MAKLLKVDGIEYDQADRKDAALIVDGWGWDLEGDYWLEFHEYAGSWQPTFLGRKPVEFSDGGVLRFKGCIVAAQPGMDANGGRTWGYRCQGLRYLMDHIPVRGYDGSGEVEFNRRIWDEGYNPAEAGKSVGDILEYMFTLHASQLSAVGITTDSTTAAQLAAMTLVPPNSVAFMGERLGVDLAMFVQTTLKHMRMVILPTGLIRFIDVTGGDEHTLTLGVDPVVPPLLQRDCASCFPRVSVLGRGRIHPARISLAGGELDPVWDSTQQAAWSMADFERPGDAYDVGEVTNTGGPTTVTVQSSDPAVWWDANFWAKRQAWIYLKKTTGIGVEYQFSAPVTACDALTAGGAATITLAVPMDGSASDAWDEYTLVGKVGDLDDPDSPSLNNVWRLFNVVTPGGLIEDNLATAFPVPVPFIGLNNASAALTIGPAALSVKDGNTFPETFMVIPEKGQVLFARPIVETWNSRADLEAGGGAVQAPDDILMLLAYSRGPLEAVYPPDDGGPVYEGTSHTEAGITDTLPVDVPSWQYEGDRGRMQALAEMIHRSVKDVAVEGVATYIGEFADVWSIGDGHRLNFAASGCTGPTGDEEIALPVRSVSVRYGWAGGGPLVTTELGLSNRCETIYDPSTFTHSMNRLGQDSPMFSQLQGPMRLGGASMQGVGGGDAGGGPSFDFGGGDSSNVDMRTGRDVRRAGDYQGEAARHSAAATQRASARQAREARPGAVRQARATAEAARSATPSRSERQARQRQAAREARERRSEEIRERNRRRSEGL